MPTSTQERTVTQGDESPSETANPDVVAAVVDGVRRGEKMVDIFGVGDDAMTDLERQAHRLYRNERYEQAKVACRGVLALDEDRPLMWLLMGDMALEEFRFSRAVDHLIEAHELAPAQAAIRARLGEALLKANEPERARGHLEAVIDDKSEAAEPMRRRCTALLKIIEG